MIFTFKLGMALGLSIITSIGAQNLFIIKQGLRNEYPYLCALTCILCDILLITLGVAGISVVIMEIPILRYGLLIFGILFLGHYGVQAIKRGFHIEGIKNNLQQLKSKQTSHLTISRLVGLALSFSLFNPQAVIDTVVIIGGSANQYTEMEKYFFVVGAMAASVSWFLGLTLVSNLLAKKLMNVTFWRVLEFTSGGIMLYVAFNFICELF